MSTKLMGSLVAMAVLLVGMGMVSAGVIRQEIEVDRRPVVILLPENFDKSHDRIPLILHLHGALPFEDAPDRELDASGYRDLPGKFKVIVAAPRGTAGPGPLPFRWNITEGCCAFAPGTEQDDVGFLNSLLTELLTRYGYPLKAGQLTYDCRYSTMHGMPVTGGPWL